MDKGRCVNVMEELWIWGRQRRPMEMDETCQLWFDSDGVVQSLEGREGRKEKTDVKVNK